MAGRGELDKIIDRSAAYEAPPPREPQYRQPEPGYPDDDRGRHGKPYKRRSLLKEIFDL